MERQATQVFEEVSSLPFADSSHIADLGSLEVIEGLSFVFAAEEAKRKEPWILEVGSGIGTITRLLVKTYRSNVIAYEVDGFCLDQLLKLRNHLPKQNRNKLHIRSELQFREAVTEEVENQDFFAIFVDGPISKKNLSLAISNSQNLKFVFVQGWRLIQRFQISTLLFRCNFSQQYIEFRQNGRPTCAVFFVNVTHGMKLRSFRCSVGFVATCITLVPKLMRNIIQSRGKTFNTGKFSEGTVKFKL